MRASHRSPLPRLTPEQLSLLRQKYPWYIRKASATDDRALLEEWIARDTDHAGRTTAEAWLAETPGVQNLLVSDRWSPVLFVRLSNAMRIDMEFAPAVSRSRLAYTLATGVPWLAGKLRDQAYRELIYESRAPRLVSFFEGMGFCESPTEHVLPL